MKFEEIIVWNNYKFIDKATELIYQTWINKRTWKSDFYEIQEKIKDSFRTKNWFPILIIVKEKEELLGLSFIKELNIKWKQWKFPFISTLCVKEEFRGKGIASKLINKLELKAKEIWIKKLYLRDWSWIPWFYEKFWYEKIINDKEEKLYFKYIN